MARVFNFEITSVPGPPPTRQELLPTEHQYALSEDSEPGDILFNNLQLCGGAIERVNKHDKWLAESVFEKQAYYLPRLEKVLLDLASTSELTSGVYFHLGLEQQVCRYFESGVYKGAMSNIFELELGQYPYCVYTEDDIEKRSAKLNDRHESISEKRKPSGEEKGKKVRNRSRQRYKQLLSSLRGLLQDLLLRLKQKNVTVKSLVVSVLRKGASAGKDDRYLFVLGPDDGEVHQKLHNHTINGKGGEVIDIHAKQNVCSLHEQFRFVSQVPNLHWTEENVGYMQTFSARSEKYLPVSPRSRYICFAIDGNLARAKDALKKIEPCRKSCEKAASGGANPPKRHKANSTTTQLTTKELLDDIRDGQAPDVSSMSTSLTMYNDYVQLLVDIGSISWRTIGDIDFAIAINSYSADSGIFLPCEFAHVTFSRTASHCTCPSFKDMITDAQRCIHTRFVEAEIISRLDLLMKQDWIAVTPLERLLHCGINDHRSAISVVGHVDVKKTVKFSVKGRTSSLEFVHLSNNGRYIACQSGTCIRSAGNPKSLEGLMQIDQVNKLCPHLHSMHASQEVWMGMISSNDESECGESGKQYFDKEKGEWQFGGLTQHKPPPERAEHHIRNVQNRLKINDSCYKRDENGYFQGVLLKPKDKPETCPCGAGYADDLQLQFKSPVTLYLRHGAAKCFVYKRACQRGLCELLYTGEEDSIYFWSHETAVGHEILYDFECQLFTKTTFSGFCEQMTSTYRSGSIAANLRFMSNVTFINCFFAWLGSMKVDFRKSIDPWCGYSPKYLACDGTPVGVAIKNLDVVPIETPDISEVKTAAHTQFNRVFLPYSNETNKNDEKQIREARAHLKYMAEKYLKNSSPSDQDEKAKGTGKGNNKEKEINEDANNQRLLAECPEQAKVLMALFLCNPSEFAPELLTSLAKLMKLLSSEAAMEEIMPYCHIGDILEILSNFSEINKLQEISCEEVYEVVLLGANSQFGSYICDFLQSIACSILRIHSTNNQTPTPEPINGTYDPSSGVAYYFSPSGEQVRRLPKYLLNGKKLSKTYNDTPEEPCLKDFPLVGKGGYSFMFLWFCPVHGHCYGFHLIPVAEGTKDAFASLLKYLSTPPQHLFHHFAHSLSEYSLNREPDYFKNVRFSHNIFPCLTHRNSFKSTKVKGLNVNSEVLEQFNSHLQSVKHTASHLSQAKF